MRRSSQGVPQNGCVCVLTVFSLRCGVRGGGVVSGGFMFRTKRRVEERDPVVSGSKLSLGRGCEKRRQRQRLGGGQNPKEGCT